MILNLFLSVGSIKAGTSWLYKQLNEHPDIYFSPEKEVHYFASLPDNSHILDNQLRIARLKSYINNINQSSNVEEISFNLRWYAKYLDNPVDDGWYDNIFNYHRGRKYCADFSNLYSIMDEKNWEIVHRATKNLRVIYTMRDPLQRLWSHTRFHMQFINKFDELKNWNVSNYSRFLNATHVAEHTKYGEIIERLRRCLNPDELKIFYFEDFRTKAKESLAEIEAFLAISRLDYEEVNLLKKINAALEIDMPDFFPELCKPIIEREYEHLSRLGVAVHQEWFRLDE